MDRQSIEYFRSRERHELEAARATSNEDARRVHLELAQGYAALVRDGEREVGAATDLG